VTLEEAVSKAQVLAAGVVRASAARNDRAAEFPHEAIEGLKAAGLLALAIPEALGGQNLGPRAFAEVTSTLAEADASVAMIYVMHVCASRVLVAGPQNRQRDVALAEVCAGRHLSTLAFSEKGSRSHFWAPVSQATPITGGEVRINAYKSWVTSAGHADSYVVSALCSDRKAPTDSTLYLVRRDSAGLRVAAPWDGMGLRANGSAPMTLEDLRIPTANRLCEDGAGMKTMLEVVLPFFNLGSSAMALGLCRASVAATAAHLKSARFEHLNTSLGEALPTLRAALARMQIQTDALGSVLFDLVQHLEAPGPLTVLRVLQSKAFAGETVIDVTSAAMRACGGAAFSKHLPVERCFRDAHASAVMAPTTEVLYDFIGKAVLGLPLF
jgi:alkylation response protein AidB-like acyl-CoA dehydrogenase